MKDHEQSARKRLIDSGTRKWSRSDAADGKIGMPKSRDSRYWRTRERRRQLQYVGGVEQANERPGVDLGAGVSVGVSE